MIFREITPEKVKISLIHLPQLLLEVTDTRNLADPGKTGFMRFRQARMMIDYLVQLWESNPYGSFTPVTCFSFQGGEPLLNMLLIGQVIEYLEKLNIRRTFINSVDTNAILLDEYGDYLAEKQVRLHIHSGRYTDAGNYGINGIESNPFHKICSNIDALQQAYPDYFTRYVKISSGRTGKETPAVLENGGPSPGYNPLFWDRFRSSKPGADTCLPFSTKLFVTADGKILPCEKTERRFAFGEITRKGVDLDFDLIAGKLNNCLNKIEQQCTHCYRNEECMQCLYSIPGISGGNPVCPGYRNK